MSWIGEKRQAPPRLHPNEICLSYHRYTLNAHDHAHRQHKELSRHPSYAEPHVCSPKFIGFQNRPLQTVPRPYPTRVNFNNTPTPRVETESQLQNPNVAATLTSKVNGKSSIYSSLESYSTRPRVVNLSCLPK